METIAMPDPATLIDHLHERRTFWLQSNAKVGVRHVPRASDMTLCARYQALMILKGHLASPPEPESVARMAAGTNAHVQFRRDMADWGIELLQAERDFCIREPKTNRALITGHIDGMVEWESFRVPVEFKSLNAWSFRATNRSEDFKQSWWMSKYLTQMMLYLYEHNAEWGLFIIGDCLGHYNFFPITLDVDVVDHALRVAAQALDAVETDCVGDLDYLDNPTMCRRCRLFECGLCTPRLAFDGEIKPVTDDVLVEMMEQHRAISQQASAAAEKAGADPSGDVLHRLSEAIKRRVRGGDDPSKSWPDGHYLLGPYEMNISTTRKAAYAVPPHVKQQYATVGKATKVIWSRLQEDPDDADDTTTS